jgi:membrane associated rhomboid family serine protease
LILICILVFILQNIFSFFNDYFILNLKTIYEYQYYRLITAIFMHGDVIHLGYNLIGLFMFGIILEKRIGSRNFLIVFLSSGIIANVIAVNFYSSSLGASGAIYGILGCLTIIEPFLMIYVFGMVAPMFVAFIIWTIGDILGAFGLYQSNTGHIAHLSGIFFGVIFGIIFYKYRIKKTKKQDLIISNDYIDIWEKRYLKS